MSRMRIRAAGALLLVIAAGFGAHGCGGLQPLACEAPLATPPGAAVGFRCAPIPENVDPVPPSVLSFDPELRNWPDRDGAFARGQPLRGRGVLARDVHPRWTDDQIDTFPGGKHARDLVPLGGDYWSDTEYPVVMDADRYWVSSAFSAPAEGASPPENRGEGPTGSMWKAFVIDTKYIRVSVGGDDDDDVGVELLVDATPDRNLSACEGSKAGHIIRRSPRVARFERYVPVQVWRGHGQEAVEVSELQTDRPNCDVKGLKAVLRIFDESPTHHVNVGAIEPADVPLDRSSRPASAPVWGFADYHTHPTSYLGFGGLQGVHTIWGAPGGSIHEYVGRRSTPWAIATDLPPCDSLAKKRFNGHHGGFAAPTMINVAEGRLSDSVSDLAEPALADVHPSQGAPTFRDFPDFRRGAHEQYHITQIHRAYLAGLRLLTALAVHNRGLEYGTGWVTCGPGGSPTVDTTADFDVVRAHVEAMRELADLNADWMQIAYTPDDARKIIRANKLAVVLGVEVAQLGEDKDGTVADQVERLDALGVRQVVVVHGMDNLLAGTALFQDLYNTVNDWMHRGDPDQVQELSGELTKGPFGPATFFQITTSPSPQGSPSPSYEPIVFRLGDPRRVVLSDVFPHPGQYTYQAQILGQTFVYGVLHPLVNTTPPFESERGPYDGYGPGHRNVRGLTGRGKEFLQRLMQHGMIIDMAHMSDQSLVDTYALSHDTCEAYPLMVSHAHFRRLALKTDYSDRLTDFVTATSADVQRDILDNTYSVTACIQDPTPANRACDPAVLAQARLARRQAPWIGPGTINPGSLGREFDVATPEIEEIGRRGAAVGVFLGQGPIDPAALSSPDGGVPPGLRFRADCAGSSKSFAAAMLFANARMRGRGATGIASDFALIQTVAPRFGPLACGDYLGAGSGSASGAQLLETMMNPDSYRIGDQRAPVMYTSGVETCAADDDKSAIGKVPCGPNVPIEPYVMGERTYDFNVDGLAHYGLVPDMLQDVANVLRDGGANGLRDGGVGRLLDPLFESAEGYIRMWERARSLAGCGASRSHCSAPPTSYDAAACGASCPKAWNHGAPLQSLDEVYGVCDVGRKIRFPSARPVPCDGKSARDAPAAAAGCHEGVDATPIYTQRRASPRDRGNLEEQGDWAVFPIHVRQTWACGDAKPQMLSCPSGANYVKVRRVLDTTVGRKVENCNFQPLPPETGNRRVVFECLAGPLAAP